MLKKLSFFVLFRLVMVSGLTVAPLVVRVNPNLNVVLTACLTVYVGCFRSVKDSPPTVRRRYQRLSFFFFISFSVKPFDINCIVFVWNDVGDDVERTCDAFPIGWECYASVPFLIVQVSLQGLGQCCPHCLLLRSWDRRSFVCRSFCLSICGQSRDFSFSFSLYTIMFVCRATLLPAISRFLPKPWNDNLIVWRFPYFKCMVLKFAFFASLFSPCIWMWFGKCNDLCFFLS